MIAKEYRTHQNWCWKSHGQKLLDADQGLQLSVGLRNRTIVPLGFLQVALLKRLQGSEPPAAHE